MSYAEYLRRKAAAAPVIIDTSPRKVDASHYTTMARMKANSTFFTSTRVGVVNNTLSPSITATQNNPKQVLAYKKTSGGRVTDASNYTSFIGGNAIREDILAGGTAPTRLLFNSSDPTSLSACVKITEPSPFTSGAFSATNIPVTASEYLNNTKHCKDLGMVEPHVQNELGPSKFVDTMRPAVPSSNTCVNGAQTPCKHIIHTHPADKPHNQYQARPQYAQKGVPNVPLDMPYKVGAPVPSKHLKYVERKHGNDLAVLRRAYPYRYQIPAGAPAHLKINDPQVPKVLFS